jgi:NAD(P)-dependent dehydrogenase (short-subunit alcohol dehydrogenase family)
VARLSPREVAPNRTRYRTLYRPGLRSRSARIVVSGRRAEAGKALATELRTLGVEAEFVVADVRHDHEVRSLVDQTVKRFGRLDVAVNNANTEGHLGPVTEQSTDSYAATFDTNVLGALLSLRHELRVTVAQGHGSIVNLSSALGQIGAPGASVYSASKHAVEGLTKSAALEVAGSGVRVNAVAPGPIETEMLNRFTGSAVARIPRRRQEAMSAMSTMSTVSGVRAVTIRPIGRRVRRSRSGHPDSSRDSLRFALETAATSAAFEAARRERINPPPARASRKRGRSETAGQFIRAEQQAFLLYAASHAQIPPRRAKIQARTQRYLPITAGIAPPSNVLTRGVRMIPCGHERRRRQRQNDPGTFFQKALLKYAA